MDHLRQKYLEEAKDLLQELEEALLLLEGDTGSKSTAETIFRVMHTLKGSSSMFGYQKIGELTHLLENCFESIREGKVNAGDELIGLTFSSLDHIRYLLQDPELENREAAERHVILLKQAIELYDDTILPGEGTSAIAGGGGETTFFIWFEPFRDILKNGSNPLYVLDDVARLGRSKTFINHRNLPPLEEMDPGQSYLTWGILLATAESEPAVKDAFLFVEDLCELKIIKLAGRDLFNDLEETELKELARRFEEENGKRELLEIIEEIGLKLAVRKNSPASGSENNEAVKDSAGSSIRVASEKLDDLMNLISELVATQARLSLLANQNIVPELNAVSEEMEKITRRLRDKTFGICLIPIENTLTRYKRLVRDLSKELNKKIVFEAEGTETELDKNVIDHLSDCLVHIFRNCIDHGIEGEEERKRKGKNPEGKILLKAYNSGASVILEVQDDGAGIDPARVKEKALHKGLIEKDQVLSEKEIYELLFHPGFSTAKAITEVSGRGVGMDVVRKKIKELRGEVNIESELNKGTTIRISIPLTISIMDGLLVRVDDTDFVLPLSFVEKSYAVNSRDLEEAFNNQLILNGEPVPCFDLSLAFSEKGLAGHGFAIQISAAGKKVALVVEEIVGEYQAVLKPLGQFYKDIDFISGASLKGDGTVVLVIDPQKLIEDLSKDTTEV